MDTDIIKLGLLVLAIITLIVALTSTITSQVVEEKMTAKFGNLLSDDCSGELIKKYSFIDGRHNLIIECTEGEK